MSSQVLGLSEKVSKYLGVYPSESESNLNSYVKNIIFFGVPFHFIIMSLIFIWKQNIDINEFVYIIMQISAISCCAFPYGTTLLHKKQIVEITETIRFNKTESKLEKVLLISSKVI